MKPFSFIHAADLHLDTPFSGISKANPTLQLILQDASLAAFDNLIQAAIRHQVDFVLFAGDIYDGVERGARAQLRFLHGLRRLNEQGISSFFIHGNHDPLEGWSALRREEFPPKAVMFDQSDEVRAEPVVRNDETLAIIHGISFRKKAENRNLALLFPNAHDDALFHIGLLHCNVGGQPGHDNYAPCTLNDLCGRSINYWALGHIHKHTVLNSADPVVLYPGNLQARRFDECGPKGCTLVQVDSFGHVKLEMLEVDVVRFARVEVDVEGLGSVDEILSACDSYAKKAVEEAEGRTLVSRISLSGRTSAYADLLKAESQGNLFSTFQDRLQFDGFWLDSVSINTLPTLNRLEISSSTGFEGSLVRLNDQLLISDEAVSRFMEVLTTELTERRRFDGLLPELRPAEARSILRQAEARLLSLLDET